AEARAEARWDRWLVGATIGLLGLGLLMVVSAGEYLALKDFHNASHFLERQVSSVIMAIVAGMGMLLLPQSWWKRLPWPFFGLSFLLMAAVPLVGRTAKGAPRWIDLGP